MKSASFPVEHENNSGYLQISAKSS